MSNVLSYSIEREAKSLESSSLSSSVLLNVSFLAAALWLLFVFINQEAVYLDDDIGHFIIARDAYRHPELIFSFWGRTVFTLLIMPFAPFGLSAARGFFLLQSLLTIWLTILVAKKLEQKRLWLIPLLFAVQPWFFNGAHQLLTEVPVMLFAIAAVFLTQRNRPCSASFLVGCLPLLRHETVAMLGCWILFCLYIRNVKSLMLLFAPMVLVNVTSYLYLGSMPFQNYLRSQGTTLYGSGAWGHYVFTTIELAGLPICMLALFGFFLSLKHQRLNIMVLWYGVLFMVNTVIYHYGLYSSGGFGIFLFPIIPILSILALLGVNVLLEKHRSSSAGVGLSFLSDAIPILFISVIALMAVYQASIRYVEKGESPRSVEMRIVSDFMKQSNSLVEESTVIHTKNVWFYHHFPLDVPYEHNAWNRSLWTANSLNRIKEGDLVVWDKYYSERWGFNLDTFMNSEKYELIKDFTHKNSRYAALFRYKG